MADRFIYVDRLSIDLCRVNPMTIYVFGDNLQRQGRAGQAIIRGEPNAYGIPTKWFPSMRKGSFLADSDEELMRSILCRDQDHLMAEMSAGRTVAWPTGGIGTGLAQLPQRAPAVFALVKDVEMKLRRAGQENANG